MDKKLRFQELSTHLAVYGFRECHKCQRLVEAKLVRDITSSGVNQVYWLCPIHNGAINSPRILIPHVALKQEGVDIDRLFVVNNYSENYQCVVCGKFGAEVHHWAPRYLFGDEADKYPTSLLCHFCHMKWHNLVTPNMGRKHV